MSTDDRMETITDPALIRATDEPDERGDFPCCTTPAPVSGAGLDLDAIEAMVRRGALYDCDALTLALVAEVRRLTRLGQCDLDLLMRAEAAEAEVVTLRAQVNGLHEELLRGDPDVVTLRARLAAVEDLHWKVGGACSHCSQRSDYAVAWPCETAVALAVTTGEGQ